MRAACRLGPTTAALLLMGSAGGGGSGGNGGCGGSGTLCTVPDPVTEAQEPRVVDLTLEPQMLGEAQEFSCDDVPLEEAAFLEPPSPDLVEQARVFFCDEQLLQQRTSAGHGARLSYFLAACGDMQEEVKQIVIAGEGKVFKLRDTLASDLDALTGGLQRVDYVYVRGGGRSKPTVVVLLANGIPAVAGSTALDWNPRRANAVEYSLNRVPYEYLRRAARGLQAVSLSADLGRYGESGVYVGMAYPTGPMELLVSEVDSDADLVETTGRVSTTLAHELAHFNHFHDEGMVPTYSCVGNFGRISYQNCQLSLVVVTLDVPFCVEERDGVSASSFVTEYARTNQLEDYAETLKFALGVTQKLSDIPFVSTDRLYDTDDCFLKQKAEFMYRRYTYDPLRAQDGDRDGVEFSLPLDSGDCDDANPAIAQACGGPEPEPTHSCDEYLIEASCRRSTSCGWCATGQGDCLEGDETGPTGSSCSAWRFDLGDLGPTI